MDLSRSAVFWRASGASKEEQRSVGSIRFARGKKRERSALAKAHKGGCGEREVQETCVGAPGALGKEGERGEVNARAHGSRIKATNALGSRGSQRTVTLFRLAPNHGKEGRCRCLRSGGSLLMDINYRSFASPQSTNSLASPLSLAPGGEILPLAFHFLVCLPYTSFPLPLLCLRDAICDSVAGLVCIHSHVRSRQGPGMRRAERAWVCDPKPQPE